jgi:hypothetical protein
MCWRIQVEKVAEEGEGALKAEGQAKDEAQGAEPEDLFRTLKLVSEGQIVQSTEITKTTARLSILTYH